MTSAALFTCSTKRVRQTLIALSNASGCVCVRGRCKACKRWNSSGAHFPQCILCHVPGCQLRAFVLSDSCLETNRRLSENTNTGSVWIRAVEDMTFLKMQKPARREPEKPWDLLSLRYIIPKYILWVIFCEFAYSSHRGLNGLENWKPISLLNWDCVP